MDDHLLKQLNEQLQRLNSQKSIQMYNNPLHLLGFMLLKGMAFGVGSVLGATLVVSLLIYLLSFVEFLPIVGDWLHRLIEELERNR